MLAERGRTTEPGAARDVLDREVGALERFGGPAVAEAAARELQYERPAVAV